MRVLVVEDHEDSLAGLVALLASYGFQPSGFNSAEAGFAAHLSNPFEIVLTDIDLPGMTGCDLARSIGAIPQPLPCDRAIVHAMSGRELGNSDRALFDKFFLKPIDLDLLLHTLKAV